MKKFKMRKEILESPEFGKLLFEYAVQETEIEDEEEIQKTINFFIERKIQQCKYQGV